jgi:uncharacterized protein (DUF2384 family)
MHIQAPDARADIGRVAAKLFFSVTEQWGLTEQQKAILAGVTSRTTLNNWKSKVINNEPIRLAPDTLERLSYIAGIYKALQLIFPSQEQALHWVTSPNQDFGGQSALERMLAGRVIDLASVRRYLDGWRGEQFG